MSQAFSESQRAREVSRVLYLTLALNWGVALVKILVGALAGSITVLADGFHSLLDGTNNVVGLVAIHQASRPPDAEHPYGHRKFEPLAAMVIGALVMLLSWETLRRAVESVVTGWKSSHGDAPPAAPVDWLFIGLVGATVAVNLGVAAYEGRAGRRLKSSLLVADSAHTGADSIVTVMGLASLLLARFGWWIDPLLALGVVGFLVRAGWGIIAENVPSFTDRSRLDPERVRSIADGVEGVRHTHAIRSHGSDNDIHLDLHIVVSEELHAGEVTRIEDAVAAALRTEFPEVTHLAVHHQTEEPDPAAPVWRD